MIITTSASAFKIALECFKRGEPTTFPGPAVGFPPSMMPKHNEWGEWVKLTGNNAKDLAYRSSNNGHFVEYRLIPFSMSAP